MKITKRHYGWIEDQEIIEYQLFNNQGAIFKCLNYGAIVTAILVPNQNGYFENVVLGFDTLSDYIAYPAYFGALVGRVAGRIKKGQWLNHQLTINGYSCTSTNPTVTASKNFSKSKICHVKAAVCVY